MRIDCGKPANQQELAPELLQAYLDTDYHVWIRNLQCTIKLDQDLPNEVDTTLAAVVAKTDNSSSVGVAVITASNPYSKQCSEEENQDRQSRLLDVLEFHGYRVHPAKGVAADGEWEEHGFLVVGISCELAKAIGTTFQQNAVVFSLGDNKAGLVFCDPGP